MRIIIEDDDRNAVETLRPSIEAHAEIMHLFIDAGPAPIEMLRRVGQLPGADLVSEDEAARTASKSPKSSAGKRAPSSEQRLNPLREGEAVARARRSTQTEASSKGSRKMETIDAGSAPKIGRRKKNG